MRERIFSLETEYAISFHAEKGDQAPDREEIVEALRRPLVREYGVSGSTFLVNGSKFHHDVGHAEWSLPECRSAREAAVYDKAADHLLGTVIPQAERQLARQGHRGRLLVVKNNVDTEGHTYGCHENYSAESESDWLGREDQLRLTVRCLVPFLVTRQIFCGAGRVGFGPRLEEGFGYQIMQRADFIDAVVSKETRSERAVVNLGRETEPLASGNYRRLHLILADANLSGWATYLKLGSTGLVLRMIEDLGFGDIPHLHDPLDALRRISRDPTCKTRVPLRDGREVSAVEIQRMYLEQARAHLQSASPSPEEAEILRLWEETLSALEQNPMSLFGKVDWVTKKGLMDRYLERAGLDWGHDLRNQSAYFELLRMDIQYHSLLPQDGLFYRLQSGRLDAMLSDDEILQARSTPPPFTRARIRGDVIAAARRTGMRVEVDKWERVQIGSYEISMGEPLDFAAPEAVALFRDGVTKQAYKPHDEEPSREPDLDSLLSALSEAVEATHDDAGHDQERSQYDLAIFTFDRSAGQRLSTALVGLGYRRARILGLPNADFNIKWGSAPTEVVEEIVSVMCRVVGLSESQVNRRHEFSSSNDSIYINLPISSR